MITEAQALAALPDRGWLRQYVDYATSITDANAGYHIAAGLAVLAQSVPISFIIPDGKIRANFYGLIVGSSTRSRKTTAAKIAKSILNLAIPEREMPAPGSEQRFVDALVENPQQIWIVTEGGPFFSSMESGYLRVLKDRITEAYDCGRLARETVKGKRVFQDNPRFSLLVAIADTYLEMNTSDEDWMSGMLARFFTIYANRERTRTRVGSNKPEEQRLADVLKGMTQYSSRLGDPFTYDRPSECLGFDADANVMWEEWFGRVNDMDSARTVQAALDRAQDMAWKIAGLLAWDYGDARSGQDWYITPDVLKPALAMTDLHVQSVVAIGDTLSSDRDMRILRRLYTAIGNAPTPLSTIFRKAQVTNRIGEEMIKTLLAHKRIQIASSGGEERSYVRTIDVDGRNGIPVVVAPMAMNSGGDPFTAAATLDDLFKE